MDWTAALKDMHLKRCKTCAQLSLELKACTCRMISFFLAIKTNGVEQTRSCKLSQQAFCELHSR